MLFSCYLGVQLVYSLGSKRWCRKLKTSKARGWRFQIGGQENTPTHAYL